MNYEDYNDEVRNLIDASVEEAVELVECMDEDSPEEEVEERTRAQYRACIARTAVDCFKRALDPEDYDQVKLPDVLVMAIVARVTDSVAFRARVL